MQHIYLDNNATTYLLREVREYIVDLMSISLANPSSAHSAGGESRQLLASVQTQIASFLGCSEESIFFTSGGTESNNWVFHSVVAKTENPVLLTSLVEHSSILKLEKSDLLGDKKLEFLTVDQAGFISLEELEVKLKSGNIGLVSLQWVNNETGAIQPIEKVISLCRQYNVLFHTDAAQAIGKLPIHFDELGCDYLTFTGHKIHAPSGIGVVIAKNPSVLKPLFCGGSQERGKRPGTENLFGIAALGKALTIRQNSFEAANKHMWRLREHFETRLLAELEDVFLNVEKNRVSNTSNLRFQGLDGQALVARLDMDGIYCSQSSACTNARPEPSYVLIAMGLSEEEAYQSIRFSFSVQNSLEEIDIAVERIKKHVQQLRLFY